MNGKRITNTKGWKNTSFEIPDELDLKPTEIREFLLFCVESFGLFKGTSQSDNYISQYPQFEKYYNELDKKEVKNKLRERIK